jgi:hypothetical protein
MAEKLSLEERIERLEKENERLRAVHEIQNLMSKWGYLLTVLHLKPEEFNDCFAERDDCSLTVADNGVYRGIESIRNLTKSTLTCGMLGPGCAADVNLSSPIIEVAGDGKTAKAYWSGAGQETMRGDPKANELRACWLWEKFAVDFIKEDGKWKIWHLSEFLTFCADYHKSWVEAGTGEYYSHLADAESTVEDLMPKPDAPSLHRHAPYNVNALREFVPAYPEPYKTYDGSEEWIDPLKPKE